MPETHLRPLSFGDILDGAFSLYRRHFGAFYLTALLPSLPLAAIWVMFGLTSDPVTDAAAVTLVFWVVMPLSMIATLLGWSALAVEVDAAYRGQPVSPSEAFSRAVGRLPALLVAFLLISVAAGFAMLLFIVPAVLLAIMLFAVLPAIVLERRGPIAAMGRSRALARGAWGRIFGLMVVLAIIAFLPTFASMMVVGTAVGFASLASGAPVGGGAGVAVMQITGLMVTAFTTPIFAAGVILLYFDRRVRVEGLDLEMETRQLVAFGD